MKKRYERVSHPPIRKKKPWQACHHALICGTDIMYNFICIDSIQFFKIRSAELETHAQSTVTKLCLREICINYSIPWRLLLFWD